MSSDSDESFSTHWDISKEWLESILQVHHGKDSNPKVKTYRVGPCPAGASMLSDILVLNFVYWIEKRKCEYSAIVKRLPFDPYRRFFITEAQFDMREIRFYTQIVPDLQAFQKQHLKKSVPEMPLPIPHCIHGHYCPPDSTEDNRESPETVLVLENLCPRGFKDAEFSRGLTLKQAEAALDAIALFHAHSLTLKVKDSQPLSEKYPFLFQTAKATDSYQQLVERGLPQLAGFLERRPGLEAVLEALLTLRPRTKEVIANLLAPEDPLALITHTDFWCNNLLFRNSDDEGEHLECAILDWQMVSYSRPTNDIALLLVSSVPTELRRRHTSALLDRYWERLTGICENLGLDVTGELQYTRSDLDRDYRRSQLLALLLCIGSVDVALGNPMTEQRLIDVLEDLHNDGVLAVKDVIEQQSKET